MTFQPYPRQGAIETGIEATKGLSHGHDNEQGTERRRTPSWFSQPPKLLAPDEAADRYRAIRSRAGAPFDSARPSLLDREIKRSFGLDHETATANQSQQRAPMAPPRKVLAARHAEVGERVYEQDDRPARKIATSPATKRQSRFPARFVLVGLAAVLTGGLIGYGVTHYKAISAKAEDVASLLKPKEVPVATIDTVTIVAKKSIATATLDVSDVSGELNSMIPLVLRAESAVADQDLILKLSGLPQSAYLTAGAKVKDNAWQLAAADAAGVKLVVPQTSKPTFNIAVAAFEAKTGELAAPIKEIIVAIDDPGLRIAPAAALPENVMVKTVEQSEALVATAVPLPKEKLSASDEPQAEARSLLAKGDILLKSGDLGMARQFYERAFAQGSTEAAIGAGKTYDPAVYAELKVHGLTPDPVRAMEWYMRASSAGNPDAAAAIEALKKATP